MRTNICVYGSSSAAIDQFYFDEAFALGALMAQKGYGLIFGGGNMGIMGAVARGCHQEGGIVTGVLPEFMNVEGIPYPDCDELVLTDTMRERKQIMEERSDAFIAAPGGIGTFEEFLEILTLKQLRRHKKAIVLLNMRGYYDNIIAMLNKSVNERFAKPQLNELYAVAATPQEAIAAIQNYTFKAAPSKWFTDIEK